MDNPRYSGTRFNDHIRRAAVDAITQALYANQGNVAAAAKTLKLQRTYLYRLIRQLGTREYGIPVRIDRVKIKGYHEQMDDAARVAIFTALSMAKGSRVKAAQILGLSRTATSVLVRRFHMERHFPPEIGGKRR